MDIGTVLVVIVLIIVFVLASKGLVKMFRKVFEEIFKRRKK